MRGREAMEYGKAINTINKIRAVIRSELNQLVGTLRWTSFSVDDEHTIGVVLTKRCCQRCCNSNRCGDECGYLCTCRPRIRDRMCAMGFSTVRIFDSEVTEIGEQNAS